MSEPKLTARTGDTLAAVARLSGSENHKGYDILHADGYVVAYVIPIDEDGAEGGKLARQFAAAPELLEALERLMLSRDASWTGGHDWEEALDEAASALAQARGEVEA